MLYVCNDNTSIIVMIVMEVHSVLDTTQKADIMEVLNDYEINKTTYFETCIVINLMKEQFQRPHQSGTQML